MASKLKNEHQRPCLGGAKLIFAAPNRTEAIRKFPCLENGVGGAGRKRSSLPGKRPVRMPHLYDFEKEVWKKIRTTNTIRADIPGSAATDAADEYRPAPAATERLFTGIAKT